MVKNNNILKIVHSSDGALKENSNPAFVSEGDIGNADKSYADYIHQQHQTSIIRYLMKRNCSKEDAEDILQETYIRITNSKNLEQNQERAKAYVYKVAINLWRDRIRKNNTYEKYKKILLHDPEDVVILPTPDQEVQVNQDLNAIKTCLISINDRCRKVFLLRIFEGLTFLEISKILAISTKTVQRDYLFALRICKEKIGSQEIE